MALAMVLALTTGSQLVAVDDLPRQSHRLGAVASSAQARNEASNAVDGNAATFWHSQWQPYQALPQQITIDQGAVTLVASLSYLPRPGGGNGTVTSYAIAVSSDGTAFVPVATGAWFPTPKRKFANFTPVPARYVRLAVLAGVGNFASAAEITLSPTPGAEIRDPPKPGRVSVLSPAYGSDITGATPISICAPGLTSATATCWKQGPGAGSDASIGSVALDAHGMGSITIPGDAFPHGPICIIITGSSGSTAAKTDRCYLQLFNRGGIPWKQGLPGPPPAARGMSLIFADDFTTMPSISSRDAKATYYDHKPPDGSQDFSSLRFTGREEPGNPFTQVDTWLRIRADENAASSGLITPWKPDGKGVTASAPCYFECRFLGPNAPGAWPAFWLLTDIVGTDAKCDELDIIEAYGGDGQGSPNAVDAYCVTPHAWNQGQAGVEAQTAALRQIRAGAGSAGMDGAPQVVSMRRIGIPSTWYQTFHVYGCQITATDTIYFCDDIEIARHRTLETSRSARFYFLINLATGGGWPVDLSRYDGKADMYIDYVRVYAGDAHGAGTHVPTK